MRRTTGHPVINPTFKINKSALEEIKILVSGFFYSFETLKINGPSCLPYGAHNKAARNYQKAGKENRNSGNDNFTQTYQ